MKEIKELDNKYLVIKLDDLDNYIGKGLDRNIFDAVCNKIRHLRVKEGKKDNNYLVLNLDDEIVMMDLLKKWFGIRMLVSNKLVKDIAVDLVNAILKAKENK